MANNLKTYNTNAQANIKTMNTNVLANVKTYDTNVNEVAPAGLSYGYFMGGSSSAGGVTPTLNSIERIKFSDDTQSVITATLATATSAQDACFSTSRGYSMGGYQAAETASIYYLVFSGETTGTLGSSLPAARRQGAGVSNGNTAGYHIAGYNAGDQTAVYKILFSSEAVSTVTDTVTAGRSFSSNIMDGTTSGYYAGGSNDAQNDGITKWVFSSETDSTLAASLSAACFGTSGSYSSTKGYVYGTNAPGSAINAITFSNDAVGTLAATLSAGTGWRFQGGMSSASAGYSAGGLDSSGNVENTIQKLLYSNESISTPGATLTTARNGEGTACVMG